MVKDDEQTKAHETVNSKSKEKEATLNTETCGCHSTDITMVEDDEQAKTHETVNNSLEGNKKKWEDAAAAKDEDDPSNFQFAWEMLQFANMVSLFMGLF